MSTEHADAPPAAATREYRITPGSAWAGSWKIAAGIGLVGMLAAGYGWWVNPDRFAFSYLFAFFVPLSVALGTLFFTMVQFVTKANWGVTVRRVAELLMRPMPIFAILVIPLVLSLPRLFPWLGAKHPGAEEHKPVAAEQADKGETTAIEEARGNPELEPKAFQDLPGRDAKERTVYAKQMDRAEELEEARIVDHKRFYLDKRFFLGRLIAYLLLWSWLAAKFFGWSTDQDKTKDLENTVSAQKFAPAGLVIFGVTLTFFSFDWFLSLDTTWYSTMFGVWFFAQSALISTTSIILMSLLLRRSGLLGDTVNVEHYHDLGKLLFGWIVFWSYIAFAQFFLTWYSNIPDEVAFFHKRWHDNGGTWKDISLAIILFHFFIPFWFLMSRNIKRRLPLLATGAVIMALMHVVEVYWVVMPNIGPLDPSWIDLAALVGTLGVYIATVLRGMQDCSLVAVGNPRLTRALEFENA